MNILKKVFGKKTSKDTDDSSSVIGTEGVDPRNNPDLIQVYDSYGREIYITKEQWRTELLPTSIKDNWNVPDNLYGIIVTALNDGFRRDVIDAARQLYKIDPHPERSSCIWGIVLMEEGRLDEAESVLQGYIKKHAESGVVLTNLAKVHSLRNNSDLAEQVLWRGLEIDPNQDNGLNWYFAIYRERDGETAAADALRRVAKLPGSWRAQLWLGRYSLVNENLQEALSNYQEAIDNAPRPVPTDLLMQLSGDLGYVNELNKLVEMTQPYFDAHLHGIAVGNNLIKAYLELGNLAQARKILSDLYAEQRDDWKDTLNYWDTEIAKLKVESRPTSQSPVKLGFLLIDGPIWLKSSAPARQLFPSVADASLKISFLGSTADIASETDSVRAQLADTPGRISRAVPLFLAEQVFFNFQTNVQILIPWIENNGGGFAFSAAPWEDNFAAEYARRPEVQSSHVVISHIRPGEKSWGINLRLIRASDGICIEKLSTSFTLSKPEDGFRELSSKLLELLLKIEEGKSLHRVPMYQVPTGELFSQYLLRLEQLLAVRCNEQNDESSSNLNGEREIVDGNLQLNLALPTNVGVRLILLNTLLGLRTCCPAVLREFKDRILKLQTEHPLTEPAQEIVDALCAQIYSN